MPVNKRNWRKQEEHIQVMNTMKALKKQLGEIVNEGRHRHSFFRATDIAPGCRYTTEGGRHKTVCLPFVVSTHRWADKARFTYTILFFHVFTALRISPTPIGVGPVWTPMVTPI